MSDVDGEAIVREVWGRMPADLRGRLADPDYLLRGIFPIRDVMWVPDGGLPPERDEGDEVWFRRGPFGAVLGRWRDTVVLVDVMRGHDV